MDTLGDLKLTSEADIPVVNLGTFLLERLEVFGDRIALVDSETGTYLTYTHLSHRVKQAAAGLQKIGVAKGDVISIVSPNHVDYLVACYASCLVSAVFQPLNPTYTKDDITTAIRSCNTKYIITTPHLYPKVRDAIVDDGFIKILVFGECEGCISFDDLLHSSTGNYRTPEVDPKTTEALLLSSSGTTGFPKSVRISHFNVAAHLLQISGARVVRLYDTCLVFQPFFHVFGLVTLSMSCHFHGGKVVVIPKFSVNGYIRLVEQHKPRTLHIVPPVVVMLAKHPRLSDYDLSSVKDIMTGTAPLSPNIEEIVKKRFNMKFISQGYGLTETIASHANTETEFRQGSVGKAMSTIETKIVDVDTGKTVGPNERGEIWIRGPNVALGYLNKPKETEEMFQKDGWLRTGDVGILDEDGYLYIVDRIKELIKYKGYQVAPATLEAILLHHGNVADVGVIGVPDEIAGELPKAFVVKRPGTVVTAAELVQFVKDRVAPHMQLRGGVEFIDVIPRSVAGKILRKVLRLRKKAAPNKL